MRIETAFALLTPDFAPPLRRLREQMALSCPRAYHNQQHIVSVLECLFAWSGAALPSLPLIAAALYHDAIYDPTQHDNEARSAVWCDEELAKIGVGTATRNKAIRLIVATAAHEMDGAEDTDTITLLDADLFVLGSDPDEYADYVAAIRTEYRHVKEAQWRSGRKAVMAKFLERDHIYRGKWRGHTQRETQARSNITEELAALSC